MSLFSESPIASTITYPRKRTRQDSDNTHSPSPISTEEGTSSNPTKRNHLYSWELVESTPPLTPESGIDINESPCSGYGANNSAFERGLQLVANNFGQQQTSASSAGTAMDVDSSARPSDHREHSFTLRIVDQPEESYRARYDSEGCRGPMKGRTGGCPAVEINSFGQKWYNGSVQVQLVSSDGSRLQSCVLDSQNEKNVSKRLQFGEKALFDNLRIRRLKKQDHKSPGKGGAGGTGMAGKGIKSTTVKGKQDEKVAYLLFTATIDTDHGPLQLKALSDSIYLNANHDPPEIHRLVPNYGSSSGGETIAIIGTRMHSPKVSFVVVSTDGKEHELIAEIDKEVSHQNALVVRVPTLPLPCTTIQTSTIAYVIVTAGKGDRGGKDPLKSSPYHFTYIARGLCKECYQRLPQTPPIIAFQGQIGSPGKVHRMIPPVLHYPHTSQPAIMTSVITIPQPISQRVPTCNYTSLPSTSSQPYSPVLTSTNTYAISHVPSPIPSAVISSGSPTVVSDGGGEQSVMEILKMLGEDNQQSPCSSPSLSCVPPNQSPTANCAPTSTIEPSITEVVSLPSMTDPAPMSPEELVRKYLPTGGIGPQASQSCSSPPACSPNACDFLQPPSSTSQSVYLSHHSVTTSQYLAGSSMLPMSVGFPQNQ